MGRKNRPVGPVTSYIAARLRAAKDAEGLTFDTLAARSGLPRSTVAKALSGDTAITVEVLPALCSALGLSAVEVTVDALRQQ